MSNDTTGALLPETRAAYDELTEAASAVGITFKIAPFGGLRSQADTARILKYRDDDYAASVRKNDPTVYLPSGSLVPIGQWRPIAPWGSSFHNFGAAFDVRIVSDGGNGAAGALALLGQMAADLGALRWGGVFKRTAHSGPDPDHFELAVPLTEARSRWEAYTQQTGQDSGEPSNEPTSGEVPSGSANPWILLVLAIVLGILIFLRGQ